ncbi:MAG: prepilin-type N-terminal cleavage/methylation domain-containing protein [Solirubrobacteraceae bacterium]|nr:prepilin-type N-terminal cleavage/methylation domain-containing protein [Solirubrobacteraceae bacterium]
MLRERLTDERGFTLPEVLIAASVGSVIIGAVLILVQYAVKTQVDTTSRMDATQKGRAAINELSRSMRSQTCAGATVFLSASATSVQFISSVGAANTTDQALQRKTITWVPDASGGTGKITETTDPMSSWTTNPAGNPTFVGTYGTGSTRTVAQDVKLVDNTSFLRYFTFQGSPATPTRELTPATAGANLADADLARIVRIDFAFKSTNAMSRSNPDLIFTNSAVNRTADPDSTQGTLPCNFR